MYDTDTGLYYLQSRYYDPKTGRFINADDTAYIGSSGTAIGDNIYTYCENDPVNNVDYTGQWYHNLSSYYKAHKKMYEGYPDAWQAFCTRYNKLKKRYKDNRSALGRFSGYIYGQKNKKVKNLKYGSNNATVAGVGCELIAIYNTLKRLGKFQYFYQVMLEAEMNDMDMLGGLWGTNPLGIAGYFDFHKIKRDMYQGESTFDRFIKSIKKAKIAIISLWNDHFYNGIHTYCIEYDKKSKKYNAYNKDVNSTYKTKINIKSFAKKEKSNFIIGFTF